MKLLTEKQVNAEIAKRNKAFKGKTLVEKRKLIAADVIQQIKTGKFIPTSGCYVDLNGGAAIKSVQKEIISGEIETCFCCGLGALFLSTTLYKNKVCVQDIFAECDNLNEIKESDEDISFLNGFDKIFRREELKQIEIYFEGWFGGKDVEESNKIDDFNEKYPDAKDRLIAICKNILKNNGVFAP